LYLKEAKTGCVGCYNHYRNGIPSFGALVVLNCFKQGLAHDLAVHVAVSYPLYISYSDIPEDVVQKEYEESEKMYFERYKDKSDVVLRKIVEGNVKGKLGGAILLEQFFYKEQNIKVCELLSKNNAEVVDFCYARIGE
jgi:elongation factor Ts